MHHALSTLYKEKKNSYQLHAQEKFLLWPLDHLQEIFKKASKFYSKLATEMIKCYNG